LILIDEATLLVRVRAPPETWTTRLQPFGQPEPERVDHLFPLVTIFSNDCSKYQHSAKRLEFHTYSLCCRGDARRVARMEAPKFLVSNAGMPLNRRAICATLANKPGT
jgi:hypothetical protein